MMQELDIFEIVETLKQKELEHLTKEVDYLEIKSQKAKLEKEKVLIEEAYNSKIAFEKDLKNTEQRKAKLYQLLQQDIAYQDLVNKLETLEEQLLQALIELKKAKIEVNYYQNLLVMIKTTVDAQKTEVFEEFTKALKTVNN